MVINLYRYKMQLVTIIVFSEISGYTRISTLHIFRNILSKHNMNIVVKSKNHNTI